MQDPESRVNVIGCFALILVMAAALTAVTVTGLSAPHKNQLNTDISALR